MIDDLRIDFVIDDRFNASMIRSWSQCIDVEPTNQSPMITSIFRSSIINP